MTPEQYAREYRRFATYVGSMDGLLLEQDLELIACGYDQHEWNHRFLEEIERTDWGLGVPLDHLSIHHYYGWETSVAELDDDGYDRFLVDALEIADHVERIGAAIDAIATGDVGVVVDEWGAWHAEATAENGLEQPGTVLDALSAAAVLDVFNHHCDVLTMTNIAQTVNVLHCLVETDGDDAWPRPTYRVFDLYAPHRGNDALVTTVDTPTRAVDDADDDLPLVCASASVSAEGDTYVTVTNLDCRDAHTVEVALEGVDTADAAVDARVLFAEQAPDLVVDAGNADEFAADDLPVETSEDALAVELPPATVAGLSVR